MPLIVMFVVQSDGLVVLANYNQSEAVRVPVPVVEVFLEGTQTKNDRTYQVNGREASTAWTDWKCSMVRCKSLGLNPRSPPHMIDH